MNSNQHPLFEAVIDLAVFFEVCPDEEVSSATAVSMLEQFAAKMGLLSESMKDDFTEFCALYALQEARAGASVERVAAIAELPSNLGWVEDG